MSNDLLTNTMPLKELVEYIKATLPNFYGSIEHQSAHETITELHQLVGCNDPYQYDENTPFEKNNQLEAYIHTLFIAIKIKTAYIESLYE